MEFLLFLVPVNKNIRPSYKISNSEETASLNLFFSAFKWSAGRYLQIMKILKDFMETN